MREKTGGETQTPFYIAILASFHHLYSEKTTRLVLFDEAFNKMDVERIQQALRLIKQMNLQMIAAVPDEKMAHMEPEVNTTIVVNRDGFTCFVDMIEKLDTSQPSDLEGDEDGYTVKTYRLSFIDSYYVETRETCGTGNHYDLIGQQRKP